MAHINQSNEQIRFFGEVWNKFVHSTFDKWEGIIFIIRMLSFFVRLCCVLYLCFLPLSFLYWKECYFWIQYIILYINYKIISLYIILNCPIFCKRWIIGMNRCNRNTTIHFFLFFLRALSFLFQIIGIRWKAERNYNIYISYNNCYKNKNWNQIINIVEINILNISN